MQAWALVRPKELLFNNEATLNQTQVQDWGFAKPLSAYSEVFLLCCSESCTL